jgi:hypothetical protein
MEEQKSSDRGSPQPDKHALPVGELPSTGPQKEPAAPLPPPAIVQQNIDSAPPNNPAPNDHGENQEPLPVRLVNEPLATRVIEDDELSIFEATTIRYARWGFGAAILTLIVAVVTGYIFFGQLKEMASQTNVLEMGAKQARIDAKNAALVTKEQLATAQRQANAAQESVKAIQAQVQLSQNQWRNEHRPWISLQNVRPSEGFSVPDPDVPDNWYVTYDVINTGHSPATRVEIRGFITIHKNINSTFRRDAPCGESDKRSDDFSFPGLTVFTGEPSVNRNYVFSFQHGDTPTYDLGGDALVVCISYRDGSTHDLHHTKMLFRAGEGDYYTDKNGRRIQRVAGFVFEDAETD